MAGKRGYCTQKHHLSYRPEKIVKIYRQEHFWLTRMGWANKTSKGFLKALREFIKDKKDKAIKL
jgi:hypothetical protein